MVKSRDQNLTYFFWPHTHNYAPTKTFYFCNSIIPELLKCHRGGINSYRISHQTGTKVARFAVVYSSANTGHAHWATHDPNQMQRQNTRNLSPPIPLTTEELLTKQKVHSACLERSSQVGCRLIHEVDTLKIGASWQGTRYPTQGPCVKRIKEPVELVGEGGIASTALYWVQSEQPLQWETRWKTMAEETPRQRQKRFVYW